MSTGKRIRELRDNLGISVAQFAKKIGVKDYKVRDSELEKQRISDDFLNKVGISYDVNLNWLLTGKGPMFTDELTALASSSGDGVQVNVYEDVAASAGYGNLSLEVQPTTVVTFDPVFLRDVMRVRHLDRLDIIRVIGDSMLPTISDGEYIMIERGGEARNGDTIIARIEDEIYVKRFYTKPFSDYVRLESDNGDYNPIELDTPEKLDNFNCIGIVRSKIKLY